MCLSSLALDDEGAVLWFVQLFLESQEEVSVLADQISKEYFCLQSTDITGLQ